MAYPGEVSRVTKTTAGGTSYTEVTVNPYASGDTVLVCVPNGVVDGASVVLVVTAHGFGGTEQALNGVRMTATRDGILDRGWIATSALAHDSAWSSNAAIADYRRVYDWVAATWNVTDVLLHGQSMGGLTMVNIAAQQAIPKVRATASIDGALNLAAAYARTAYKPTITSAYGIASDGSDYAARTAGHDATQIPPTAFAGQWLFLEASPNDVDIVKTLHSDVFVANMGSAPATLIYKTGSGTHVATANFMPTDVLAFYGAALAAHPVPPPIASPPSQLPTGLVEVELWGVVGGQLVKLTPVI